MTKDFSCLGSSSDTSMREYIITLKDHNDSDGFYADMETEGGSITIPNRACECCNRRAISRNTHYHLTYDEARQVLDDDRVLAVELTPCERGLKPIPYSWITSSTTFDKRVASDAGDVNWGFVTSSSPNKITGWVGDLARDVVSEYSGKNVDVLIADDGVPYPSTLEFAQNPDGTGYPRLIQYNWFKHNSELGLGANGTYDYSLEATTNEPRLQEHGAHTMGTSGGNTQGWARDANLYFFSFYDNNMADYVRAWHNSKPINPETGVRNPTVMNNSWGYIPIQFNTSYVSQIGYQGSVYNPSSGSATAGTAVWDQTLLDNFWCTSSLTRVAAVDTDYEDMIADGIIVVASAGNSNSFMDVPGGVDYDNYFDYWNTDDSTTYRAYPHRGSSPGAAVGVINVGAAGSHDEAQGASIYDATNVEDNYYRAEFSNFGPRCDIWAAGAGIQSIWRSTDTLYDNVAAPDARLTALGLTDTLNNNFKKCPGTSMSGPQVCGILACLAEAYPRMTQADARNFLAKKNIQTMDTTLGGRTDPSDLGTSKDADSGIKYAGQWGHRYTDPSLGTTTPVPVAYPEGHTAFRPDSGSMYPRTHRLFSRNSSPTYALSVDNTTVTVAPSSETYDITVTAPSSSYYTLSGTDRNGSVSGNDVGVTCNVGDTLNFNMSNVSTIHPFRLRVSSGGADVSTPTATGQGATGNETCSWTPNTAGTYYYQCASHPSMIGTITVNSTGSNSATVTLTTTNVPDGTEIPYLITSKYRGTGKTTVNTTDTGVINASDSSNTYVTTITGANFGDGDGSGTVGTEKSHVINMSAAGTNPIWIDDPAGFNRYDFNGAIDPNIPAAGAVNIDITAPTSTAYITTGSDRVESNFNRANGTIYANYGDTIEFTINSGASHPFYIKYTTANGGTNDQVTAGVTNQGATSGSVIIDTTTVVTSQGETLDPAYGELILYYQCSAHSAMRGMIVIRSRNYPTTFNDTNSELIFTGSKDDGYWKFTLPWTIPIFGSNQSDIYVGTNSYVTFGSGTTQFSNTQNITRDKILLSSGDGSAQYGVLFYVGGTAPNRFGFIDMFTNTLPNGSASTDTWVQLKFYENDVNNIYLAVLMNGRYAVTTFEDRYPFYQDEILGGTDTTGVFTVNNNTATLTITPDASYTNPDDGAMNVNVRLDMFNTPEIDFNVTS